MNSKEQSGYIAILGRPNVGKSTLLNCLLKKKISIISPKPQTTRHQILGINTVGSIQAIYIDTPGIHQTEGRAMSRYLNRLASAIIPDVDVIVFMVEATRFNAEDELVLEKIKSAGTSVPVILAINKIDEIKDKRVLLPFIEKVQALYIFKKIIPISVIRRDNIDVLEREIMQLLPESPHHFPDEQITDKPEKFQIAELIREKLIQFTEQELPYSTAVEIETLTHSEKVIKISAIIWVERPGQKAIVIGEGGERLKKIGTLARKDIEKLLGQKVFLRLWVKIKEHWTDDDRALKNLGYN
jgi:GTPase